MKFSAVIAASLPLVALTTSPAFAGEQATSTAGWLKESLQTLKAEKPASAAQSKIKMAAAPALGGVKLRPFQPNRYLPSEKELQRAALQAQQAQLDQSMEQQQAQLTGRASAYYAPAEASPYEAMVRKLPAAVQHKIKEKMSGSMARAPRAVPNQMPMTPSISNIPIPFIPEPPRQQQAQFPMNMPFASMQQNQMQAPMGMNNGMAMNNGMCMNNAMGMPQMGMSPQMCMQGQMQPQMQFNPQLMQQQMMMQQQMQQHSMMQQMQSGQGRGQMNQAGMLSESQRAEFEKVTWLPTNGPAFNGDMSALVMDNPSNGAGPPPFPMNLLNKGTHGGTSQARFGSWHSREGLPRAGFQSYVTQHSKLSYVKAPVVDPIVIKRKSNSTKAKPAVRTHAAKTSHAKPAPKPYVAAYPPYRTSGLF